MPEIGDSDARTLGELRDRIDAIDAEMHRLLIERGTVIEALIATKGTRRPGAAFRPGREADMMRRLVDRHEGALPLATVEHIWREIITTFTRMQAPFDVAIDGSFEPEKMRDLARFTFGFSVGLNTVADAAAVVARVAGANDLGLVARRAAGPWWRGLVGAGAPRIMAILPFIGARERPADLPAFVISPPLADPTPPEVGVFAVAGTQRFGSVAGVEVLASAAGEALLAALATADETALSKRLGEAGIKATAVTAVGGFARGIAVDGGSSVLYQAADRVGGGG